MSSPRLLLQEEIIPTCTNIFCGLTKHFLAMGDLVDRSGDIGHFRFLEGFLFHEVDVMLHGGYFEFKEG